MRAPMYTHTRARTHTCRYSCICYIFLVLPDIITTDLLTTSTDADWAQTKLWFTNPFLLAYREWRGALVGDFSLRVRKDSRLPNTNMHTFPHIQIWNVQRLTLILFHLLRKRSAELRDVLKPESPIICEIHKIGSFYVFRLCIIAHSK